MQQTAVKYIGLREHYVEGCYGSRIEFAHGESKLVPSDLAAKLLRHSDVYAPGEEEKASAVIIPLKPQKETEEEVQDVRDAIQNMDMKSLKEFAKTHYRRDFHPSQKLETVRKGVIQLVDLYGVN